MLNANFILLLNLIVTWYLVGLIWTIQLVHYPHFDLVGETNWLTYHRKHSTMITWAVAPAMLLELASSIALIIYRPAVVSAGLAWVGAVIVIAIWLSTAFLQVPLHSRLAKAFDAKTCRSLVAGNWVRTALWTARGGIVTYAMSRVLAGHW